MVYAHYYEGETDKNGKVMDFEEFEYFPVTIANGDVMVSTVAKSLREASGTRFDSAHLHIGYRRVDRKH